MQDAILINAESVINIDTPVNEISNTPVRIVSSMDMDRKLGSFKMNSLLSRYFTFHQVSLDFNYKAIVSATKPQGKHFGLALMSTGQGHATFDERNKYNVIGGSGLFTYNPAVTEQHCFFPDKPTQVNYFEINEQYFNNLLFEHEESSGALTKVKDKVSRGEFLDSHVTICSAHHRIVTDITACPLEGSLGNLMMEGSLQQLIALQLAAFGTSSDKNKDINSRDKETMYAVKNHLDHTFLEDHSLVTLSKYFGINQGKLKKDFKRIFGVPVIEYVFNLRMEHARALLDNGGMFVPWQFMHTVDRYFPYSIDNPG